MPYTPTWNSPYMNPYLPQYNQGYQVQAPVNGITKANGGTMAGHTDPVQAIRDMISMADGDTRRRIRRELDGM